jgi:fructose-1,6-bisphosphatase/inositol monophosphatase family enzyme
MYYDVYSHSLAITGRVAATIEYNLKIWDLSATQALIEGAGGEFLELGREGSQDGVVKHHAVFGKPLAVKQIAKYLLA